MQAGVSMIRIEILALGMVAVGTVALACSSAADLTSTPPVLSTATAAPTPVHTPIRFGAPKPPPALVDDPDVGISIGSTEELGWAPPDDEATRRADLIVIATVGLPGEAFWTTISGERPGVTVEGKLPDLPADELRWGSSPQIFTPWTFNVVETLKGHVPVSGPVLVNRWGGAIPPDSFLLDGEVAFVSGEKIVLFLKDCGPGRAEKYGSPYRFIKRLVVTPEGTARNVLGYESIPIGELLGVIQREKDQSPLAEISCN